jgi:hypothetical protein
MKSGWGWFLMRHNLIAKHKFDISFQRRVRRKRREKIFKKVMSNVFLNK